MREVPTLTTLHNTKFSYYTAICIYIWFAIIVPLDHLISGLWREGLNLKEWLPVFSKAFRITLINHLVTIPIILLILFLVSLGIDKIRAKSSGLRFNDESAWKE